jgi:hypothetical protein
VESVPERRGGTWVTREQIKPCLRLRRGASTRRRRFVSVPPVQLMRILFDQGVPRGLAASLRSHAVTEARKLNWERISNGALLKLAEDAGFDLWLTSFPYQTMFWLALDWVRTSQYAVAADNEGFTTDVMVTGGNDSRPVSPRSSFRARPPFDLLNLCTALR